MYPAKTIKKKLVKCLVAVWLTDIKYYDQPDDMHIFYALPNEKQK